MRPFVEQLVQDAGVGVLGYKAGAEEFEAFGCYFPDDAGVVQEPPAAKGVYVGKFSARDAEFVLVFAREEGDEEVDVGPVACNAFEVGDVPFAQAVATVFEEWVDLPGDADHHCRGDLQFMGRGIYDVAHHLCDAVFRGIGKVRGERYGHVSGVHFLDPVGEIATQFRKGFVG